MMMKKYIIIIFALFLLGISLQYAGINFGSSRLTDSTSYITTNRPFMVNGNLNFTGTLLQNGSPYSSSGIDTNSYFNKYRLDTSKYFNPYRLDTAKILFTDQQNGYALFDSTYNGRLITNGDLFMNDGGNIVWRTTPQLSISGQINEIIGTAHKFNYYTQFGTQLAYIGSRLCEAVDFGKQKFNNIQKFNR